MAEADTVRIEVAFDGGPGFSSLVQTSSADELERALAGGAEGTVALETADGRYTIVLRRVAYVKRDARESRVGFGI